MEAKQTELLYESAYDAYQNKMFNQVLAFNAQAEKQFPTHKLIPKFNLLNAFALAGLGQTDDYLSELQKITKKYPGGVEAQKAQEILNAILNAINTTTPAIEDAQVKKAASVFNLVPNAKHWLVFYAKNTALDFNRLRFDVFNISVDDFSTQNLNVDAQTIDKTQVVVVKEFENKDKAMVASQKFMKTLIEQKKQEANNFDVFIITDENYQKFKTDGDVFLYQTFYKKYYLGN
jgi:TolA-binding protein